MTFDVKLFKTFLCTGSSVQAELQGPWASCFRNKSNPLCSLLHFVVFVNNCSLVIRFILWDNTLHARITFLLLQFNLTFAPFSDFPHHTRVFSLAAFSPCIKSNWSYFLPVRSYRWPWSIKSLIVGILLNKNMFVGMNNHKVNITNHINTTLIERGFGLSLDMDQLRSSTSCLFPQ